MIASWNIISSDGEWAAGDVSVVMGWNGRDDYHSRIALDRQGNKQLVILTHSL